MSSTMLRRLIVMSLIVLWEVLPRCGLVPELFLPSLSSTLAAGWNDAAEYWTGAAGDAVRGRRRHGVRLRRRNPGGRHRRQPAAAAPADHADGVEPLCRAAGDPLSGFHGVARNRAGIQDRIRFDLRFPSDHAGDRGGNPDHRSAIVAGRPQHGRDARPACHPRDDSGCDSHRALGPAGRRRPGHRRGRGVGDADFVGGDRLSDLALPHHPGKRACVRGRAAGAGAGGRVQCTDPADRAARRGLADRQPRRSQRHGAGNRPQGCSRRAPVS